MVDDSPYSKREQDEKFIDMKEQLNRIETQTLKTNGTVAALNIKQAKQDGFNSAAMLFVGVSWTVFIAVSGWALLQIINIPQEINHSVKTAIESYQVTVVK